MKFGVVDVLEEAVPSTQNRKRAVKGTQPAARSNEGANELAKLGKARSKTAQRDFFFFFFRIRDEY